MKLFVEPSKKVIDLFVRQMIPEHERSTVQIMLEFALDAAFKGVIFTDDVETMTVAFTLSKEIEYGRGAQGDPIVFQLALDELKKTEVAVPVLVAATRGHHRHLSTITRGEYNDAFDRITGRI